MDALLCVDTGYIDAHGCNVAYGYRMHFCSLIQDTLLPIDTGDTGCTVAYGYTVADRNWIHCCLRIQDALLPIYKNVFNCHEYSNDGLLPS